METAKEVGCWFAKSALESSIGWLTSSALKRLKRDPAMKNALLGLNASVRKVETHMKCLLKQLKEAAGDAADGLKYEQVRKRVEDGGDRSKKRKRYQLSNLISSSLDHLLNDPTFKVRKVQKRLDKIAAAIEQVVSKSSAVGEEEIDRVTEQSYSFMLDSVVGRVEDQERLTDPLVLKRRIFQIFAHNINGRITKKELRDSLKKIIDDDLGSMIDVDRDERIEEDFRVAFNNFDENGDGFTTADKLRSALNMFDEKRDGFVTLTAEGHTSSSSSSRVLFECRTCNRQFQSFQALGGHRDSHKIKPKPKSAAATLGFVDQIRSDEHHQAVLAKPKIAEIGARLYQRTMDECIEEDFLAEFNKFNKNRDGFRTADKLRSAFNTFDDDDENADAFITVDELRSAFDMFDQNGDEFITIDELRSVVASIGLKQGRTVEDRRRRMIRNVGVDGDGKVNFKEFKQMMRGDGFAVLC